MADPVQDFYDRWTEQYHSFSSNKVVDKWRKESISDLEIDRGSTVVDIGCGTGANVPILRSKVGPEGDVFCLDISSDSLQMIRDRAKDHSWDNVHTLQADGNNIPLKNVDFCVATFSIGMFKYPVSTIKNMARQFGEGTRLCLVNVVKSDRSGGFILNKPLQVFTGMSVPSDLKTKIELSKSGEALDSLDNKIRGVHSYLGNNHTVISHEHRLNGCITWISVEFEQSDNI